ncbi:LacI family DNA-binding transcriptional regulator [Jiangella endophytica]|uniref:LacI family DNA-binding transcriptional regulator n=1 Tax=Jiangella endophytica TaxID=1623398 RepID=UPI000E3472B4|nr:LacI family DNA-binding transcriptional regulator [Jiangella endophytica]
MTAGATSKRPTIREVAQLAGVSHQTVSRYLRRNGGLKAATVAKIDAAVAELDYQPDLVARAMRTRRLGTVAVLIPGWSSHVFQRELSAACLAARSAGFRVEIVVEVGGSRARRERVRALLGGRQVEGVLSLAPLGHVDDPAGQEYGGAVVVSADFDDEMRNIGALADGSPAAEIVEYLASLGHRHFLHVAGHPAFASARSRRLAYSHAIERLGLVSHGVVGFDWGPKVGYESLAALPADSEVTAIVAANDEVAIGAMRAARERGWAVPGRVSVFGWDDLRVGEYSTPSLSTVSVDRELRGGFAMRQLIAVVRGEEPPPVPEAGLNRLLLRESTGPAP